MTYQDKIKQSSSILEAIYGLEQDQSIKVAYGTDRDGKPNHYSIKAYSSYKGKMSYSIWNGINGMNIDSIGKTTMKAYTYDMMSQRTTYTFPLYSMDVIPQDK